MVGQNKTFKRLGQIFCPKSPFDLPLAVVGELKTLELFGEHVHIQSASNERQILKVDVLDTICISALHSSPGAGVSERASVITEQILEILANSTDEEFHFGLISQERRVKAAKRRVRRDEEIDHLRT